MYFFYLDVVQSALLKSCCEFKKYKDQKPEKRNKNWQFETKTILLTSDKSDMKLFFGMLFTAKAIKHAKRKQKTNPKKTCKNTIKNANMQNIIFFAGL